MSIHPFRSNSTILQRYVDQQDNRYASCLDQQHEGASIYVVIPCYNEPDILSTLNSLAGCSPPVQVVSVLVVVNDSSDSPDNVIDQNILTLEIIERWQLQHPRLFFKVQRIYAHSLPQKWAGVGWGRKLGMDEATRQMVKNNFTEGIIISLDADSTVSPNYLQAIEKAFDENPLSNFFTIHFEHPFEITGLNPAVREGIIRYELHMRYYRNALKWSGYPHAIYTVGSSFAMKTSAYVKQGGMNRRKAGEDFYFLHKLVLLGQYGNISATTVFPGSRESDRVPFGTGAALRKWIEGNPELHSTYSIEAFRCLKPLFTNVRRFWTMQISEITGSFSTLNPSLQTYCENSEAIPHLVELKDNCSTVKVFEKRFFHLFNAFWILKYLNFVHETTFAREELRRASLILLQNTGIQYKENISLENILEIFRNSDRNAEYNG